VRGRQSRRQRETLLYQQLIDKAGARFDVHVARMKKEKDKERK
jgi:hypothetical protein